MIFLRELRPVGAFLESLREMNHILADINLALAMLHDNILLFDLLSILQTPLPVVAVFGIEKID